MYKKIRNILSLVLTFVIFVSFITFSSYVKAAEENYHEFAGSRYYQEEVTDQTYLGYGVDYHREKGFLGVFESGVAVGNAAGSGGGGPIQVGKYYPNQINILEIDKNADIELVPYAILKGSSWNTSTVRNAAKEYELSNPDYKVIAAINGDFFKISQDIKASTGVTVSQGEFFKSVDNHGNGTIAIKKDEDGFKLFSPVIEGTIPTLSIYDENNNIIKKINIDKVNQEPSLDETSLYYATRNKSFYAGVTDVTCNNAWVVENATKAVTTTEGNSSFYGKGKITEYSSDDVAIKEGDFAIKTNNSEITGLLKKDVIIRAQFEFTNPELEGIQNYIGTPCRIVADGTYVASSEYRHPRTIIGQTEAGKIVLAVVDGRQPTDNMYGVSYGEMAALMTAYGCVDVWNLDGGGSSTLIIRKQGDFVMDSYKDRSDSNWYVTNSPSDKSERSDGNCLLLVTKTPQTTIAINELSSSSVTLDVVLLTDLEKFKELYIMINSEYVPVIDGKATFTKLVANTDYRAFIYAKVDGKMTNLMNDLPFHTAYLNPGDLTIHYSLTTKNNIPCVLIKYHFDHPEAVLKVTIVTDNKSYPCSSLESIQVISYELFENLINYHYTLTYDLKDRNGNQVIDVNDFTEKRTCSYILEEIETLSNGFLNNIWFN